MNNFDRAIKIVRDTKKCRAAVFDMLLEYWDAEGVSVNQLPVKVAQLYANPPEGVVELVPGQPLASAGGTCQIGPISIKDDSLRPLFAFAMGFWFGAEIGDKIRAWEIIDDDYFMTAGFIRVDRPNFGEEAERKSIRNLKRGVLSEVDGNFTVPLEWVGRSDQVEYGLGNAGIGGNWVEFGGYGRIPWDSVEVDTVAKGTVRIKWNGPPSNLIPLETISPSPLLPWSTEFALTEQRIFDDIVRRMGLPPALVIDRYPSDEPIIKNTARPDF